MKKYVFKAVLMQRYLENEVELENDVISKHENRWVDYCEGKEAIFDEGEEWGMIQNEDNPHDGVMAFYQVNREWCELIG